jgi:hypothetical protein
MGRRVGPLTAKAYAMEAGGRAWPNRPDPCSQPVLRCLTSPWRNPAPGRDAEWLAKGEDPQGRRELRAASGH